MEVAALLGEIAGGVQWGCILYHRVALSFLFPYQVREYLEAERKADTPPPKRARMAQSGPRECAEMQEKREGRACHNVQTQCAFILNGTWRSLKRDLKEHQYCFENEQHRRCDALR